MCATRSPWDERCLACVGKCFGYFELTLPICSMYDIYLLIHEWLIFFTVNVGIYTIDGLYEFCFKLGRSVLSHVSHLMS